jgi:hypothetical protein
MTNASKSYCGARPSGVVTKRSTGGSGGVGVAAVAHSVDDLHGKVLTQVKVQLIFWGSSWAANPAPKPSSLQVAAAVGKILLSSYMVGILQYRNAGGNTLAGSTLATESEPPTPFSDDDVARFLGGLIDSNIVPKPSSDDQLLYVVVMPIGVKSATPNVVGEHTFFAASDKANAHFAWVTNDGTLATITEIFSHELVESCTDPEGDGFQIEPTDPNNWNEIGDVCEGSNAIVDGINVQTYWSAKDGRCITP